MRTTEQQQHRDALVTGLRCFAAWLERHPHLRTPAAQPFLLPLSNDAAVVRFAVDNRLPLDAVVRDDAGNASLEVTFGPITCHIYGYEDCGGYVGGERTRPRRYPRQNTRPQRRTHRRGRP